MTRRKFIQELIKTGVAVIAGVCWVARKAAPRKFIRAISLNKYPGHLKPLKDVHKQSKWSG